MSSYTALTASAKHKTRKNSHFPGRSGDVAQDHFARHDGRTETLQKCPTLS